MLLYLYHYMSDNFNSGIFYDLRVFSGRTKNVTPPGRRTAGLKNKNPQTGAFLYQFSFQSRRRRFCNTNRNDLS